MDARRRSRRVPRYPARPVGYAGDRRAAELPEPNADPAWRFEVSGSTPSVNARSRRGDGGQAVRRARAGAEERSAWISTPATFVAGVYGDGPGHPASGAVPAPDWTGLRLMVAGSAMTLAFERRDHRARARAGHASRHRLRLLAAAAAQRSQRAHAYRPVRLSRRPPGAGCPGGGHAGGLLRLAVWQSAIGVSHAGGPTRETRFEVLDDPPALIASTRGRNGGGHVLAGATNPAPARPAGRAHAAAGARRHRRAPRARGPGHGGPARHDRRARTRCRRRRSLAGL